MLDLGFFSAFPAFTDAWVAISMWWESLFHSPNPGGYDGDSDPPVRVGRQLDGVDTLAGAHSSLVELLALTQHLPRAAGDGWAVVTAV
jgi:hypothetical protein